MSQTIDKTEGHGERDGTTPRTALAPVRQRGLAHRIRHRWFYWLRFVGNNGTGLGAIIAAIALPIAGLWSLYAYINDQHRQLQDASERHDRDIAIALRDSQRPFLEKQLSIYLSIVNITSAIANITSTSKYEQEDIKTPLEKFWRLYYGELAAVQTDRVAEAVIEFGKKIGEMQNSSVVADSLKYHSLCIAHAVRHSIQATWQPIESLGTSPPPSRWHILTADVPPDVLKADSWALCSEPTANLGFAPAPLGNDHRQ